jgi:hypothetical protein
MSFRMDQMDDIMFDPEDAHRHDEVATRLAFYAARVCPEFG